MIDIRELFRSVNSTREFLELEYPVEDFEQLELTEPVKAKIALMRLDEGITMLIEELTSSVKTTCVRCGKAVTVALKTTEGEWLFYEKPPHEVDDQNEFLLIDKEEFEIDPMEPLRQELILGVPVAPHCEVECKEFEASGEGVKSLAGLKDLFKE